MHNNNSYVNNSQYPPMPVCPPPVVYNPPMPEQLPEPPANMNFNETAPLEDRLGTKKTNPIIEHYNQVERGDISRSRPNNLAPLLAILSGLKTKTQ